MVQDIEDEMRKHSQQQQKSITTNEIDTTSSRMVITDSQRRGEIQTIGDLIGNEDNPEVPIGWKIVSDGQETVSVGIRWLVSRSGGWDSLKFRNVLKAVVATWP